MPAPTTLDEFVDLVRKSGVLEEPKLAGYVQQLKAGPPLPADLTQVAGLFIRDGAPHLLPGRAVPPGQVEAVHHRQVQGARAARVGRHGAGVPVRAQAHAPAGGGEGAADGQGPGPGRASSGSTARPAPSRPSTTRTSSGPTTSTRTRACTSSSWSTWTGPTSRTSSSGPGRSTRSGPATTSTGPRSASSTPTRSASIHRDIKPGNVLVDRAGVVKILDMGLARFFHDDDDPLTKKYDENVLGTADYLAPEQAIDSHVRGHPGRHLLARRRRSTSCSPASPPFPEGTVAQKLLWHQTSRPRSRDPGVAVGRAGRGDRHPREDDGEEAGGPLPVAGRGGRRWPRSWPGPSRPRRPRRCRRCRPRRGAGSGGLAASAATRTTLVQRPATARAGGPSKPASDSGLALQAKVAGVAAPAKPETGPLVEPMAEDDPAGGRVWEAMATDTTDSARSDTGRKQKPARRGAPAAVPAAEPVGPKPNRRKVLWIALAGGGLILAATAAWYFGFRSPPVVKGSADDGARKGFRESAGDARGGAGGAVRDGGQGGRGGQAGGPRRLDAVALGRAGYRVGRAVERDHRSGGRQAGGVAAAGDGGGGAVVPAGVGRGRRLPGGRHHVRRARQGADAPSASAGSVPASCSRTWS